MSIISNENLICYQSKLLSFFQLIFVPHRETFFAICKYNISNQLGEKGITSMERKPKIFINLIKVQCPGVKIAKFFVVEKNTTILQPHLISN